jgi:hypothetical protein
MSEIPQYHIPRAEITTLEKQFKAVQLHLTCTAPRYLLKSGDYYTEWEVRDAKGSRAIMWARERQSNNDDTAAFTVGSKDFHLLKQVQGLLATISVEIDCPKSQL